MVLLDFQGEANASAALALLREMSARQIARPAIGIVDERNTAAVVRVRRSPISRPYLAHISPMSRPYLAHISPISPLTRCA
jgi:hypothetical protein